MATNERTLKDHLSLTERVYATLREMILSMELAPGTRLKDVDLAQRLGVSNTPLREAMRLLAADSLVETIPRRGTVVKTVSAEETGLLYEIREALEVLATGLVARRASQETLQKILDVAESHRKAVELRHLHEYLDLDRRFHSLIAEGSQNPILVSMLSMIADRIHIVRRMTSNLEKDVLTGNEHHGIAAALMIRDAEKAASLMQQHIRRHGERIRQYLLKEGGEGVGGQATIS